MKFNTVIGNPPYNNDLYLDFVELGHQRANKYSLWITPAKWQAKGGDKNERFRQTIVPYMSKIVYYPNCSDIFLIAEQSGISYYMINNSSISTKKEIINKCVYQPILNNKSTRNLSQGAIVLNNHVQSIYNKLHPSDRVHIFDNNATHYLKYSIIINSRVSNERGVKNQYQALGMVSYSSGKMSVMREPSIIEDIVPDIDMTNADTVIFTSDNYEECESICSFLNTKFVRFLVSGSITTLSPAVSDITMRLVPDPGAFDHIFTDEELYKRYNLTKEEINIIESVIKERK